MGGMPVEPSDEPRERAEKTARAWDRRIALLAERQHGMVGRKQLLALGMGRRAIGGRVERGTLHEVQRGVYAVGHRVLTPNSRLSSALIAAGSGAVLSHRTAGRLWGLTAGSGAIELTCPTWHRTRRAGVLAHESSLAADEVDEVDGFPVTSPFRTVIDLASVPGPRQLERVLNEVEVLGLTDSVPMGVMVERHRGRRGIGKLRRLLAAHRPEGVTRNEFEERFVALLDRHDLPRGRINADLCVRDRFYEIDCLWERERLALELDGRAVHGTRAAFESDRERDRILVTEGWRVARVTWRQLRDAPEVVAADLRRLLLGRAAD